MPYQLGELPTVTLIVLSALFAMLMRDGLELPQLYTQLLGHDQAHGL